MLRDLDTDSLENATFEQLNSLVGILDDVVRSVEGNMKMRQIEARIGNNMTMKMPVIDQAERSQFMSSKAIEVDEVAAQRAEEAYMRANPKKK